MSALLWMLLFVAPATSLETNPDFNQALLEEAWERVDDGFYDPEFHGVEWDDILSAYRPLARLAKTRDELYDVINDMLAHLKASHLVLMSEATYKNLSAALSGERKPTLGMQLVRVRGRLFVRSLWDGGAAKQGGVLVGDRIVAINGVDADKSLRVIDGGGDPGLEGQDLALIRVDNDPIDITLQRTPDESSRQTVRLQPRPFSGVDAFEQSLRFYRSGDRRYAYMHLWYMAPIDIVDRVKEIMRGPFQEADGLILDLRGRGGYVRVVEELRDCFVGRNRVWDKPMVALIDERTRSAKEAFAQYARDDGFGFLVGRKTEGAVLAGLMETLRDGSVLMIPGFAVPVNGISLEGRGVAPDFEVDQPLEYARGRDPILSKGLEVLRASVELRARERATRRGR